MAFQMMRILALVLIVTACVNSEGEEREKIAAICKRKYQYCMDDCRWTIYVLCVPNCMTKYLRCRLGKEKKEDFLTIWEE
ncbi:hypothetical protein ScPMuIL_016741 [Solemya velum]